MEKTNNNKNQTEKVNNCCETIMQNCCDSSEINCCGTITDDCREALKNYCDTIEEAGCIPNCCDSGKTVICAVIPDDNCCDNVAEGCCTPVSE